MTGASSPYSWDRAARRPVSRAFDWGLPPPGKALFVGGTQSEGAREMSA